MRKSRIFAALVIASVLGVVAGQAGALAGTDPTGEVTVGNHSTVEPAYDSSTGDLVYLLTPSGSAAHVNPQFAHNVAPIYLPVYPDSTGTYSGVLNCQDTSTIFNTTENCPDHGPEVSFAASNIYPNIPNAPYAAEVGSVYANGARGHNHLVGIASTGGDFNILWEPVLVLFTNTAAAKDNVTTLDQINTLVADGDAVLFEAPQLTFPCSVVGAAVYNHGTPVA
jgi:hypothetical protein